MRGAEGSEMEARAVGPLGSAGSTMICPRGRRVFASAAIPFAGCVVGYVIVSVVIRFLWPERWDLGFALLMGAGWLAAGLLAGSVAVVGARRERFINITATDITGPTNFGRRRTIRFAELDLARSVSGRPSVRYQGVPSRLYSNNGAWISIDRDAFDPEDLRKIAESVGLLPSQASVEV